MCVSREEYVVIIESERVHAQHNIHKCGTLIVSYIIIIMPCYLNQYVTVYQVIFKVLNFRILPKFEIFRKM